MNAAALAVPFRYKQRMTIFGSDGPASFHAVIEEQGKPHEVQARRGGGGWTVTTADRHGVRTAQAAPDRIDLSTADLVDPGSRWTLGRFQQVRVLSAESGDIWPGEVTALPAETLDIDGVQIPIRGWRWDSPAGKHTFWYDAEGWLVRYETRVMGVVVEGLLDDPPPKGPDVFAVPVGRVSVEQIDL